MSSLLLGFSLGTENAEGKVDDQWQDEVAGPQLNFDSVVKELEEHYAASVVPMLTCELDTHGTRVTVKNEREFKEALDLW
jgi:hypothetical protein